MSLVFWLESSLGLPLICECDVYIMLVIIDSVPKESESYLINSL